MAGPIAQNSSPVRRRSTKQVRQLVLDAALIEFANHGFGGATTRAIADRAGVKHSTMYRNFPSKENLFNEAVLVPFASFLRTFRDHWVAAPPANRDPELMLRPFVTELFDIVRQHRHLLLAMKSSPEAVDLIAETFSALEEAGVVIAALRDGPIDIEVGVRVATLMVVAVGLAEEIVFPPASFTTERLLDEMVTALVARAVYRPDNHAQGLPPAIDTQRLSAEET